MHLQAVRFIVSVLLGSMLAASSSAALLLYEPFDYASGQGLAGMAGQAGVDGRTPATGTPFGLTAPNGRTWMSGFYNSNNPYNPGNDALTTAVDLSYLNLQKTPGTGAVTLGGTGSIPRLAFDPVTHGPGGSAVDVYYSFVFRLDSLASTIPAGGLIAAFNNIRGSQSGTMNTAGAAVYAKASGAGFVLGMLKQGADSSQATYDSNVLDFGESYFVVGKYTIRGTLNVGGTPPTSSTDDSAQLWINPTSLGGAEPGGALVPLAVRTDVPTNQGDGNAVIQSFFLRQDGFGGTIAGAPTSIVIDELRIGTTYADVTPIVPEPLSVVMLILATAVGASGWRRRK